MATALDAEFVMLGIHEIPKSGCAKKQIAAGCWIQGKFISASNTCLHAGETCPRRDLPTGVGYDLCEAIHAEAQLADKIRAIGEPVDVVWVLGHYYACEPCAAALKAVGVQEIRVREYITSAQRQPYVDQRHLSAFPALQMAQ